MATDIKQPLHYVMDLGSGLSRTPMHGQMMKGDKKANRVIVELMDGADPADLTGVTVTGSFIRPGDAAEIPLIGSVDGNRAIVVLDDACYAQEGYCEIGVKLTMGETARTVLTLTGYVLSKGSGAYVDVGNVIPSLDEVIEQYSEMKRVTRETQEAGSAAEEAAKKIDGMTVSATSSSTAGATISEVNGVKHIAFQLPKGEPGDTGADGVSPIVSVQSITGGHRVSITDNAGTKTFDVMNGKDGTGGGGTGEAGEDGGYYMPSVDSAGNLTWTASKAGMPSVSGANIKGPTGATGATGATGPAGKDGANGTTPVRGIDYWTAADIAEIKNYVDDAILNGAW